MRVLPRLALLAAVLAACDDDFGPLDWDDTPQSAVIYSLHRPELLGRASAYDFIALVPQRVEVPGATGAWDVALGEEDGRLVLLPAGALPGVTSRAGIAPIRDRSFDEVVRAPGEAEAYRVDGAVPLSLDEVYVIRTRVRPGTGCLHYARMQVLALDAEQGRIEFHAVRNPTCNNRALVPPGG